MMDRPGNKNDRHPGASRDPAASVCEQKTLSARGRAPLDADFRRHDETRKYRMLGLAVAAICANIGFSAAHDPDFSMKQAVMLTVLCIVTTYVIYRAVSAVEALATRRSRKN